VRLYDINDHHQGKV